MKRPFKQVDVFTATPLTGNPLAVVLDGSGLDTATMQRFFTGNNGIAEDPVTGSLNAALAQWLIGDGLAPPGYVAAQGTAMGRAGRVFVQREGEDIWIGGHSATVIDGSVEL